jgi:hypothetical protein
MPKGMITVSIRAGIKSPINQKRSLLLLQMARATANINKR